MTARNHTENIPYVHPEDPAGHLKPDEPLLIDGLDWSWAFIWHKDIPGFPGYRVGNDGWVWSRLDFRGGIKGPWRKLIGNRDKDGYLVMHLRANGQTTWRKLAHLVLEAFVGPRPEGLIACHFPDVNRANNAVGNLRWGTYQSNTDDMIACGTRTFGERHPSAKLTDEAVNEIRRLRSEEGMMIDELAARFKTGKSNISCIIRGKTWTHLLQKSG